MYGGPTQLLRAPTQLSVTHSLRAPTRLSVTHSLTHSLRHSTPSTHPATHLVTQNISLTPSHHPVSHHQPVSSHHHISPFPRNSGVQRRASRHTSASAAAGARYKPNAVVCMCITKVQYRILSTQLSFVGGGKGGGGNCVYIDYLM